MTVVYFIVVRVLIAIFYDCYKEASREVTDNLIQHQNNHIIRAFGILREGEKYGTSRKSPSKSYTILQDDTISIQSVVDVTLTLFPVSLFFFFFLFHFLNNFTQQCIS